MHKRTAHALVENEDGVDVYLKDALDLANQTKGKRKISTLQNVRGRFSEGAGIELKNC